MLGLRQLLGFSVSGYDNIPTLAVAVIPNGGSRAIDKMAHRIARALGRFPYFIVVSGFRTPGDPDELKRLVRAVGARGGQCTDQKFSFTEVKVDPAAVARTRKATAYSRTHLPLAPHTDSSYLPTPHQLVAFQCVVADARGGENAMVPVDTVLDRLSEREREILSQPIFPFSRGNFPVLARDRSGANIRYYRRQIDQAVADGAVIPAEALASLDRLDTILDNEANAFPFKLGEGDAVIFNNTKVLHARRGFPEQSNRELFRIRYHVDVEQASRRFAFSGLLGGTRHMRHAEPTSPPSGATLAPLRPVAPPTADQQPSTIPANRNRAKALAERGRFHEALPAIRAALEEKPADLDLMRHLAGLYYQADDWDAMQGVMAAISALFPVLEEGSQKPYLPVVMRARGMKGAKYRLTSRGGRYTASFEGGHFSLKELMDDVAANEAILHVFDSAPVLPEGTGLPDLLLNTIACADRMAASLQALADFCSAYPHMPVINDPLKVLQTSREMNARRLNDIDGLVFPQTKRVGWDGDGLPAVQQAFSAAGFTFPLIVRPVETHTGVGVARVHTMEELSRYFYAAQPGRDYYLIQYHDLSGNDGLFRKSRTFCIDGRYYPVASLTHNDWNVHSGDRYSVMDKNPDLQTAEQAYLSGFEGWLGPDNLARLETVRDMVGLDFFGIDFTKLPDGRLFLFELNAAMRHNFDHVGAFPYTAPYLQAVSAAFGKMIDTRLGDSRSKWLALSNRAGM